MPVENPRQKFDQLVEDGFCIVESGIHHSGVSLYRSVRADCCLSRLRCRLSKTSTQCRESRAPLCQDV